MECGCEIDLEGEGPSLFTETKPVAKKEHTCCECGRTIMPGEKYTNESGMWFGKFQIYKTCSDCMSVRDEFFCSFIYGEIWERIAERIDEDGGEISFVKLAELTPRAREQFCQIWEDWQDEYELNNPLRVSLRLGARMGKHQWEKYRQKDWVRARIRDVESISSAYDY